MESVKSHRDHFATAEKSDIHLNPVKILVCGTTAAKRSTICNAIVGEPLLEESNETYSRKTFEDALNGLHIEVVSVALYDRFRHKDLEKYHKDLEEIKEESFDLFLYCLPMKGSRFSREDKTAYDELKQLVNEEIWGRCVVVFTNADSIVKAAQTKYKTNQISKQVRRDYEEAMAASSESIENLFGRSFPFHLAGSPGCYSILKNDDSWLSNLFGAVTEVVDENTGLVLLLKNVHRLKPRRDAREVTEVHEDPIIVSEGSKINNLRVRKIIAGLSAGGIAGGIGATAGALIGALVIGIPSFGVFAKAGLALGGAIGGGIGVAAGAAGANAVQKNKMKQNLVQEKGVMS